MSNPLPVPFEFGSNKVRTITQGDAIWFVAADVCKVLGIINPSKAVKRLDDDERANFKLGRQGNAHIINESGLYALVLRSNKPEARKFTKWVTSEVLPAIRKTGRYGTTPEAPPDIDVRALMLEGMSTPTVPQPADIQARINKRAWAMAHEAYELCRQHLTKRVAYYSEVGNPRVVNEERARAVIAQSNLGNALAHTFWRKLNAVESQSKALLHYAQALSNEFDVFMGRKSK